jgi:meiotically up-regulated gene 157 (Mug157) protein
VADADRLGKIASIGQDLITTQLAMAMQTPSQALEGGWVLGYCFGVFDALAQQADLDDGADVFSLITLGFLGLFADPADPEAAMFVRRSLDSQDNPRFQEGAAAGGNDVFVWVADRAKVPNALFEHLSR